MSTSFFNALEAICFRKSRCIRPMGKCCKKWQNKKRVLDLFFKISVLKDQIINKTCASVTQVCNRLLSRASCVIMKLSLSFISLHRTNQRFVVIVKTLEAPLVEKGQCFIYIGYTELHKEGILTPNPIQISGCLEALD